MHAPSLICLCRSGTEDRQDKSSPGDLVYLPQNGRGRFVWKRRAQQNHLLHRPRKLSSRWENDYWLPLRASGEWTNSRAFGISQNQKRAFEIWGFEGNGRDVFWKDSKEADPPFGVPPESDLLQWGRSCRHGFDDGMLPGRKRAIGKRDVASGAFMATGWANGRNASLHIPVVRIGSE